MHRGSSEEIKSDITMKSSSTNNSSNSSETNNNEYVQLPILPISSILDSAKNLSLRDSLKKWHIQNQKKVNKKEMTIKQQKLYNQINRVDDYIKKYYKE